MNTLKLEKRIVSCGLKECRISEEMRMKTTQVKRNSLVQVESKTKNSEYKREFKEFYLE